ncbi:hypothetical protein A33M_0395 [Rhodovulum sp. PH10]|uniref:hypothetical protein n=1 Tax=Rhodovulum sp. PH10 TaxID=1187851 RepID=UPI00027C26D2|nr:hypothetical protein [Rhodovulum sp. PH10]EJW10146.1 hypothetical protein A33M_0395 [Rhodovulum sp. PH10]
MPDTRPIRTLAADERAALRRAYETAGTTLKGVAKDFGVSPSSLTLVAEREGWRRGGTAASRPKSKPPQARVRRQKKRSMADRLERLLAKEISRVEAVRRDAAAPDVADAERVARTLERLTDTLGKVRRLREPEAREPDDDLPRDIDEFRRVLARRIAELVQDEDDGAGAGGVEPGEPDASG